MVSNNYPSFFPILIQLQLANIGAIKQQCILQSKTWKVNPQEHIYTEENYKCNTFVFAPIFRELNSKI